MKLHIIMGRRPESDVPEALDCWDEYTIDENPDGFEEAIRTHKAKSDFAAVSVVIVSISTKAVMAILDPPNELDGKVVLT